MAKAHAPASTMDIMTGAPFRRWTMRTVPVFSASVVLNLHCDLPHH
jgi:hypothetical protein